MVSSSVRRRRRASSTCPIAFIISSGLEISIIALNAAASKSVVRSTFFFIVYPIVAFSSQEVLGYISRRDYKGLLEHDQLLKEQKRGKAFDSFGEKINYLLLRRLAIINPLTDEEEIGFQPTYRYARGTRQKYDYRKMKKTYVRINLPSYCDRVLWKSYPETSITNTSYGAKETRWK